MIFRLLTVTFTATAVFSLNFNAVEAATIDIVRSGAELIESTHGLRDDTGTDGTDLDGAMITATYADGTSEQITWEGDPRIFTDPDGSTYGSINGWARGADTDLFMSWDGFEMTTTSVLTSLSIDLAPASAVFDTTFIFDDNDPNGESTQGSSFGFPFELYSGYENLEGAITATYTGIVNLVGDAPVGDLFTTMSLDFSMLLGGGILGDLGFRSDIDVMRNEGDLSPVPLPTSLSFLLIALAGLGLTHLAGRRRILVPTQTGLPQKA